MKRTNSITLVVIFLLTVLSISGCFKQEETPLMVFNGKATHTIQQVFDLHSLGEDASLITDDIIITGIVVSTDEFGICYKEIFIQDGTGGISIRTSNSSYYNKYRIGQRVYVKCKDLYLGSYIARNKNTGWYQLGLWGNGQMQYIPGNIENRHVFRSGIPEPKPILKTIKSIDDVNRINDFHTLVKLTNCTFVDANGSNTLYDVSLTYSSVSRNIKLESGNKDIIARISQYCTFGDSIIPSGPLNITGILTMYGTDIQLYICSWSDIERIPPPGGTTIAIYDMNSNPFDLGWTNNSVQGSEVWKYSSLLKQIGIAGSSSEQTECRLVSPKLNFATNKDVTLYLTSSNFNGIAGKDNLQLLYTSNGTNWSSLDIPLIPIEFEEIAVSIPKNLLSPDFQIAFKYIDNKSSRWTISKIEFKVK